MRYLKQNTATVIVVGPFLDVTDGITPEVALTVTGCHLTLVVDNAGTPTLALDADATASAGSNDMVHITNDDAGMYSLELTAANLNYVGGAILTIINTANHLPVFHEFTILPANVYDSMIAGTDLLDANASQLGGTTQTGNDVGADVNDILVDTAVIGALGAGLTAIPWNAAWDAEVQSEAADALIAYDPPTNAEIPTAAAISDAVWDEAIAGHLGAGTTGNALNAAGSAGDPWSTSIPGAYGAGTAGKILGDNVNAPIATVDTVVDGIATNVTAILSDTGTDGVVVAAASKTGYALSAAGIQAVWDALTSALTTVGSIGKRIVDYLTGDTYARLGAPAGASTAADIAAIKAETAAIVADTNEMQTDDYPTSIAAVKGDTAAILIDTGTTLDAALAVVDANVDAILVDTADMQPKLGTPAGVSISADIAAIEAQTDDIGAAGAGLTALASQASLNTIDDFLDTEIASILEDTGTTLPAQIAALNNLSAAQVNAEVVDVLRTDTIPDSVAADGSLPTITQAVYEILQYLTERSITGTTMTVKKVDGTTTLMTLTLDDGTAPTSQTRAT